MSKELIYETEHGPNDLLYQFVYEFEPYDSGRTYGPPEKCYPPEGGTATINEIRSAHGDKIPDSRWVEFGFDEAAIKELEEKIYADHAEGLRDAAEGAAEDAADAKRERDMERE